MAMVHQSKRKTARIYASPSQDKLAAYGIEAICLDIADLLSYRQIAEKIGVALGQLSEWLDLEPERQSLARAARMRSAAGWDQLAEQEIRAADSTLALGKARELATHYRWRAPRLNPGEYGDKVQVQHSGRVEHALVSDDELSRRLAAFSGLTIDEAGEIVED